MKNDGFCWFARVEKTGLAGYKNETMPLFFNIVISFVVVQNPSF